MVEPHRPDSVAGLKCLGYVREHTFYWPLLPHRRLHQCLRRAPLWAWIRLELPRRPVLLGLHSP